MSQCKIIIKSEFRDIRDFDLIHKVGEVCQVDEERANALIRAGLATEYAEPTPEEQTTTAEDGQATTKRKKKHTADDDSRLPI